MKVAGTFNGTAAAVYICIGFVPDWVRVVALEDADIGHTWWSKHFRAAEVSHGIHYVGSSNATQQDARTASDGGILPFVGLDILTSTEQTSTSYGEGVYLGWDDKDYRQDNDYGYDANVIDTWTLDTSANRTGKFNEDTIATVSRIGEGSQIWIRETASGLVKRAVIEACTAGAGEADDEVTLSEAINSGTILRISGMYSMAPIAVNRGAPAGFKVEHTTVVNVNDEIQFFEAGTYDRK